MSRQHGTKQGKRCVMDAHEHVDTAANVDSRQLGQLFIMGFDGTTINDQLRSLIVSYHVGSILLAAKNFECAVPFA